MRSTALLLALGLVIGGCADPYARPQRSARPGVPRHVRESDAAGTARAFADRWVNWDWRSAAAQQRLLAAIATGQLGADLRSNARSARIDATLARDKPSVRGLVAAVELRAGGTGAAGLVVTRERGYTAGRPDLGGARYRVYLIELRRMRTRWGVSAWKPQP